MKHLILGIVFVTILFSCSNSDSKKTTYSITDWMVTMPTNFITMDGGNGWAKMVIYSDSIQYKEDTASNGDVTKHRSIVSDTFYMIRTADMAFPYKDSTGKQMIDPSSHQPIYWLSWRNQSVIPKNVVKPQFVIPKEYLPSMYSAIPHDTTAPKPPTQPKTDSAKHSPTHK